MADSFNINSFKLVVKFFFIISLIIGATLSLFVYLNYSKPILSANASIADDFKIQRNCTSSTESSVTLVAGTAYIAPTATNNAFIRLTSTKLTGAGKLGSGGSQSPNQYTWYISDPDFSGNSVTFTRDSSANNQFFCWEIIEYIGPTGGPNEFIVSKFGTVTYTNGTDLTYSALTPVDPTSVSKSVIFITGQNSISGTAANIASAQNTAEWSSSTPIFRRGIATNNANSISYAVVHFRGTNWSVQRTEHQFLIAGFTEMQPISSVGNISQAFTHAQFRRSDSNTNTYDGGAEMWLSSTTQASFKLHPGAQASGKYGVLWIVSNSESSPTTKLKVQHIIGARPAGPGNFDSWSHAIPTPVASLESTSIMGESNSTEGSTSRFPGGWISITASTTSYVQLYQSDDLRANYYRFQVVEWPKSNPVVISQSAYRFFNNLDSTSVGTALASTSVAATLPSSGASFRLRLLLHASSSQMSVSANTFRLQYAQSTDAGCIGYTDISTSTPIAFINNASVSDHVALTVSSDDPSHGNDPVIVQTYNESNNFTNSIGMVPVGQDGIFDFALRDNGAEPSTPYCLKAEYNFNEDIGNHIYDNIKYTEYSPASLMATGVGFAFSPDGQAAYYLDTYNNIHIYSLGTAWDVSTMSQGGSYALDDGSFDPDNLDIKDFAIKADGTKLYALRTDRKEIMQYSFAVPWDFNTLTHDVGVKLTLNSHNGSTPWSLAVSNDAKRFYIGYFHPPHNIYQYSLAGEELNTGTYDNKYIYVGEGSQAMGLFFSGDGSKIYIAGGGGSGAGGFIGSLYNDIKSWFYNKLAWFKTDIAYGFGAGGAAGGGQCTLTTPWDISTATCDTVKYLSGDDSDGTPAGIEAMVLGDNHTKLYLFGIKTDEFAPYAQFGVVYQHSLAESPLTTMSYNLIPQLTTSATSTTFSSLIQNSYRWYGDVNSKDPTNNDAIALENTKINNLATNRNRHLRISVKSPDGDFPVNNSFKLQYQKATTTGSWTTVGSGGSPAFSGNNYGCCVSGENINSLLLIGSSIKETYEEGGTTGTTTNIITTGNIAEWDFGIHSNASAELGATYYFRMIGSNDVVFNSYLNYPSLSVSPDGATSAGEVKSIIYDTQSLGSAQLNSFLWEGTQPDASSIVKLQFASATSSSPSGGWDSLFSGPQGTLSWYTSSGPNIQTVLNPSHHKGIRYFRYKVRLESSSGISPVVKRVIVNWSP